MDIKNTKFLFTGGHLTPALAVLEELKNSGFNNITWIGTKYNQAGAKNLTAEYNTITDLKIPFYSIKPGKLIRDWGFNTFIYGIKNLILIIWGFIRAFYLILIIRPQIIISFGGFVALPIVICAKLLGKRVVTHEQTIVTGLANKIISNFANIVFVSWESSKQYIKNKNIIFSGNPIRKDVFKINDSNLLSDFNNNLPTILVMGGNQGANKINTAIFNILNDLLIDFNVIHQTGNSTVTNDNKKAMHLKLSLSKEKQKRYIPLDYINGKDIGFILKISNILISRSGANTITEILALGIPSILIPIPNTSYNEQINNAKFVENTGLGIYLPQNQLTKNKLLQTIYLVRNQINANKSLNNKNLAESKKIAKSLVNLDSAKIIVKEIENLLLK